MLKPEDGPHDLPSARLNNAITALTLNVYALHDPNADPGDVISELCADIEVVKEIAIALKAGRWSDGIPL